MKKSIPKMSLRHERRGAALIVTLSLIVLITALLLAFFVNSTLNRQLETSSASRVETDILTRSALELIIGDIKKEMLAGSMDVSVTGGILRPVNNAVMQPSRILADASLLNNSEFDNLVKQSVESVPFFPLSAPYTNNSAIAKIASVSQVGTGVSAKNSRKISVARWNAPKLLRGAGFTNDAQAPRWVYLGRDGLASASGTNVIGRFAFNVYNIGGLANINVAGFPSGLSTQERASLKGTPYGASLEGSIPGVSNLDAFIDWRNAQTGSNFVSEVLSNTNGFRQPEGAGSRLVSRQELIRYSRLNPANINSNALPYLTTFSLEKNTPSWGPVTNAPALAYPYYTQSTLTGSTNRLLTSMGRGSDQTVRSYGVNGAERVYSAKAGDPLVERRFPLDCLRWITSAGPLSGISAQAILSRFGLQWQDDDLRWEYVAKNSLGNIATLDEVAALPSAREPNFFELLKAGILRGSLGKEGGISISDTVTYDQNADYQIIQIGCNIIDQYRADDFPTRVLFDASVPVFAGVVDLPYMNKLINLFYRPLAGSATSILPQDLNRSIMGGWMVPEFWRPHARSAFSSLSPSFQEIRLKINRGNFLLKTHSTTMTIDYPQALSGSSLEIKVSGDSFRAIPDVIHTPENAEVTSAPPHAQIVDEPGGFSSLYGINVAFTDRFKDKGFLQADPTGAAMRAASITPALGESAEICLEMKNQDGVWVSYDTVKNYQYQGDKAFGLAPNELSTANGRNDPDFLNVYLIPSALITSLRGANDYSGKGLLRAVPVSSIARSDPRSDRFGLTTFMGTQLGWLRASPLKTSAVAIYSDPSIGPRPSYNNAQDGYLPERGGARARGQSGKVNAIGQHSTGGGWFNTTVGGPYAGNFPGALTDNKPGGGDGALYYEDNDGVQRRALGAYSAYYMNDDARKPVMLNRRFFSVGDLGYVHRGEPWKNLDFFTKESADAGLLDIFTTSDLGEVTEGKVNINSAPPEVISSYLKGAVDSEISGTLLPAGSADLIAQRIREEVRASPLLNKSELVTRFVDASALRNAVNNPDKARHEAYVRGLADIAQTRTWNLMIDVIAQKGRVSQGGGLENFIVEGERRYWLHVAIDRFTGEIVGQKLEAVYE